MNWQCQVASSLPPGHPLLIMVALRSDVDAWTCAQAGHSDLKNQTSLPKAWEKTPTTLQWIGVVKTKRKSLKEKLGCISDILNFLD
jgi:hypothetical protein